MKPASGVVSRKLSHALQRSMTGEGVDTAERSLIA